MLSQMSWAQYMSWQSYARIEPFGEERADLRAGIVASTLANVNRDSARKPDPFEPKDFMPDFAGDRAPKPLTSKQEWAQVKAKAKAYAKGGSFAQDGQRRTQQTRTNAPTQSSPMNRRRGNTTTMTVMSPNTND